MTEDSFPVPPLLMKKSRNWRDMKDAPKDRRIIIATADNLYIAKWAQDICSGEEAFSVGYMGSGDRLIIKKELALKWTDAPEHPFNQTTLDDE